jgi:xanthine dehydrogenase accessory factor
MAEVMAVKNAVQLPRDMEVASAKDALDIQANDPGAVICGIVPPPGA